MVKRCGRFKFQPPQCYHAKSLTAAVCTNTCGPQRPVSSETIPQSGPAAHCTPLRMCTFAMLLVHFDLHTAGGLSAKQLPRQHDAQRRHMRHAHAVVQLPGVIKHAQLHWRRPHVALTQQLALELTDGQAVYCSLIAYACAGFKLVAWSETDIFQGCPNGTSTTELPWPACAQACVYACRSSASCCCCWLFRAGEVYARGCPCAWMMGGVPGSCSYQGMRKPYRQFSRHGSLDIALRHSPKAGGRPEFALTTQQLWHCPAHLAILLSELQLSMSSRAAL